MTYVSRFELLRGEVPNDVLDRIVQDLIDSNPGAFEVFRKEPVDALWDYHHSLGRHIRNHYRLWESPELVMALCKGGHPDDASSIVIKELWRRLQNESNS